MGLTNIANRLTPSAPIQLTFGPTPVGFGTKMTTLFGHMAATPGTGTPYQVYNVVNVGDPVAGPAEVEALAGVNAQITAMAKAFITANALGGFGNFPQFRVVLIPYSVSNFGPNQEAINAVMLLRSDMLVSCYPAGNSANATTLLNLATLISGIDRDLSGQFGSFVSLGSIDPLATAEAYAFNSRYMVVHYLPDSNTASVPILGTTTALSDVITAVSQAPITQSGATVASNAQITVASTAGIYPGATITDAHSAIPTNTTVETIIGSTILVLSNECTLTESSDTFTITNLPTAGIYPGAIVTDTDSAFQAGTVVISVAATTVTVSNPATSTNASEAITIANQISQPPEVIASAGAAGMMGEPIPYVPLQNVVVGGLVPPQKTSDWISINPSGASEAALAAGLAPMTVQPGGTVGFIRTRTTYTENPEMVTATAYFDWQDLVKMNDFREACFAIIESPPFNNNPGGTMASQFTAALLKDAILSEALFFESQQMFQGVKTLAPQFQVAPSTTSRGRFDFQIPVNVLPGLFVVAGNIVGVAGADFGDFTL